LRHAAWLAALVLAVIGIEQDSPAQALPLHLAAAAVFALGTILPGMMRWPCLALLLVLYPLFWIGSRLLPALAWLSEKALAPLNRWLVRVALHQPSETETTTFSPSSSKGESAGHSHTV
jgi:hypothetical protein